MSLTSRNPVVPTYSVAVSAVVAQSDVSVQADEFSVPLTALNEDVPRVSFLCGTHDRSFGLPMRESSPLADLGGGGLTFLLEPPAPVPVVEPVTVEPDVPDQSASPGALVIDTSGVDLVTPVAPSPVDALPASSSIPVVDPVAQSSASVAVPSSPQPDVAPPVASEDDSVSGEDVEDVSSTVEEVDEPGN